jgi:hypothetical protein
MAERKSFLLRIDRELLDAVQRWADDDLRSVNGQIEFLIRRALRDVGRAAKGASGTDAPVTVSEHTESAYNGEPSSPE